MEKYVIDLDKVLDELELHDNDESAGHYGQTYSSSSGISNPTNPLHNFYRFPASSIVNAYEIDVRDADFSIQTKPPKILNSIAVLESSSFSSLEQRTNVQTNCQNNNNDNDNSASHEEAPCSTVNHLETCKPAPTSQPSSHQPSAVNESESVSTLVGECHSPSESALPQQQLAPVDTPVTAALENSPAHRCDNVDEACDDSNRSSSSSSRDMASSGLSLSVIEDVLPGEVANSNSADLNLNVNANLNVTPNGAIAKEDQMVQSTVRGESEEQQVNELINNDPICDSAIQEESIVALNLETDQPPPPPPHDLKEILQVTAVATAEEPQQILTEDIENGSTQINEELDKAEEIVPACEENIAPTTGTTATDEMSQLDINNMSEEDLDKFLSDLVLQDSGQQVESIEQNDATTAIAVEKVVDESGATQTAATSQIVEGELSVADKDQAPADGHHRPSEMPAMTEEETVEEEEAAGSAPSTEAETTLDVPVVVDAAVAGAASESDSGQLEPSMSSIPSAEASAIISECSSNSVRETVNEVPGDDSCRTATRPESSRPQSLTLPQSEVVDEVSQQVPEVEVAAEQSAPEPSTTSNNEANNRLVQNIAYFERQEMPNGLTEEEQMLGKVKPFWIPDEEAQNCLHCDSKFTLIKRRHHCRSCGKVLCSQCCNFKAKLMYLENKEARVCQLCYAVLMRIEAIEKANGHPIDISQINDQATSEGGNALTINYPDPNNPAEYCSTISPFDQASEAQTRPPPTVMVPVGVLKRPGSSGFRRGGATSSESSLQDRPAELQQMPVKQVIFSDGVRPGGDLVESPSTSRLLEDRPVGRTQLQLKSPPVEKPFLPIEPTPTAKRVKPSRVVVADSNAVNLPPILNYNELRAIDSALPSKPTYSQLLQCLRSPHLPAITFGLTKNLFVNTKLVSKICCNSIECWAFASRGLATVGQDEVFFCLDCSSLIRPSTSSEDVDKGNSAALSGDQQLPEFPRDVFRLFTAIYDSASKASLYSELSHIFFPDGLFGNKENSGFIFTRPSLQCFQNVLLPSPPNLIAILIHKWEIPWAKVFPLRLALRLGHEYSIYPTPVISFANRKPVYFEIGHTIMNVLADFRNFQYTLSVVKDLVIHVEERKRVSLQIPKLSYEKVCKTMSTCNEHVLAFGGNFSGKQADSHFVCVQNEQDDDVHGQYHTQVARFEGSPQKVTGASFIVFSGALKSSTGLKGKMNIVEDGLLVQIPPTTMEELRAAIRDMKDFQIDCCKVAEAESPDEWVRVSWVNDELSTNLGVRSQIDGLNLEGVQSARIFSSPDYTNDRYLIRWIEVFLLQINENSRRSEMLNTSRLAESVSQAFCVALIDFLDQLYENGLTKIGLRVSLDVDKVGYEAGSAGEQLPPQFTGQLDGALIPAIMENVSTTGIEDKLVIELLFYILLK